MRLFGTTFDEQLICQAGQSLLGKSYEYVESPRIRDAIFDALSIISLESKGEKVRISDINMQARYSFIKEALDFSSKAELKYGIVSPVESILIWIAIIKGYSINGILSEDIEINNMMWTDKDCIKEKVNKFLEIPNRDLQAMMGNLPAINCAVAVVSGGIDMSIVNNSNNLLLEKMKRIHKSKKLKHYVLLDTSKTMTSYTEYPTTKLNYISAIILGIMESANQDEISILFHKERDIVDKIEIKEGSDKRRFWMNFGAEKFRSDYMPENSLDPIYRILGSEDYEQDKASKKEVNITMITDRDSRSDYTNQIADLAAVLNFQQIKLNLFIVEAPSDVTYSSWINLINLLAKLKKKSLFVPDGNKLVDCTNKIKRWIKKGSCH